MASRSSLYKWKRQENKPVFSSRGNVQQWVKQVQKASDDAARDIFGDQTSNVFSQHNVFVDDAAISEAQDLLDSWIHRKKVDDLLAECDHADEKWSHNRREHSFVNGVEPYRLGDDGAIHYDAADFYSQGISTEAVKPAVEINDDFDEEYAFQEIVHNMLGKDLVNIDSVSKDVSQSKTTKFRDPTPKMELRHKQVKEKAKQRKVTLGNAAQKNISQKVVEEEARKQVNKEEREQQAKVKREEDDIRREMVKIRKATQEENKLKEKHRMREKVDEERACTLAKEQILEQQKENELQMKRENAAKAAMRRMLIEQLKKDETRQKKEDLKLLHKCFSTWCAIIVNKRIKMGKARALFDWRRKLRAWNAWRTYVWRMKSERETRALTQEMKERHRKETLADRFYHQLICQRCLTAWLSYVWKEKQERRVKEQHDERANKMASLLKAAASGQFWQKSEEKDSNGSANQECNSEEVEEIFLEPLKRGPECNLATDQKQDANSQNRNNNGARLGRKYKSKQAWPHEVLRDMKMQKTATKTKPVPRVTNTAVIIDEHGSQTTKISDNISDVKCKVAHKPANTVLKSAGVVPHKPDIISDVRNVVACAPSSVAVTVEPKVDTNFGNGPLSTRSSASLISKESKASSRKPTTKPLHLAMEERAKARVERKAHLEAKKKEEEIQTLAKLKQEQEQKEKEVEAEKQAVLQKRREEKKIAKQREFEKQQRFDELRKLNQKADDHYRTTLTKNYGFSPWKRLIKALKEKDEKAVRFNKNWLQNNCFCEWLSYTRRERERREVLAKKLHERLLLRRSWLSWRKYRYHLVKMHRIAINFSTRYLARKYIRVWQDFAIEERLLYWDKENRADEHNERRLKQIAMTYWKKYIPLLREEAKHEKRREDLRKRVQALLPDFKRVNPNQSP